MDMRLPMAADLCINSDRMLADFNELAEIGATVDGGISRLALSNEDLEARAWLADCFLDAGLVVRDDDAGNLSGVLPSADLQAQSFLLGAHLDSVPNGGRYDSSVGLVTALEAVRAIQEAGLKLPFHLEVINFTDEEGCWQSLFGSRALTGTLTEVYTSDRDADYGPFRAALFRAGIYPADIYRASRDPETVAGYLELHIEQGYRLDDAGIDIGVVTGIVGRTTYYLTFYGEASHSGTTALDKRRDALLGAAAFICEAHKLARASYPEGVFNCGSIEVSPGAFNIIPAEARLTIECRHFDHDQLAEMESVLIRLAQEQANEHKLTVNVKRAIHMPAARMDANTVETIETVCQSHDVSFTRLISYAGHDAQIMSNFTSSGMIFIPSQGGISHSPREFTEWHHVVKGANVLLHTILALAEQYRHAQQG
jgi:beta-ureidopropionase / N-carbamoyl-L-amino-acid hydrolase